MHDQDPHAYTLPGRLLLVFVILLPIVGTWGTIYLLADSLPSGRYPVLLFAVPYVLLSALLFFAGSSTLRKFGYRVRKDDAISTDGKITSLSLPDDESTLEANVSLNNTAFCSTCNKEVEIDEDERCIHCRWPV